jgi:hypothetical protein
MEFNNKEIKNIEYVGQPGITKPCQDAVLRLLQFGEKIQKVLILTCDQEHGLLITISPGDLIAVKSGFASGYGGEGPRRFSYILTLLKSFGFDSEIEECEVKKDIMERLDRSALTVKDLKIIQTSKPIRPTRFFDYILEDHFDIESDEPWHEFPPVIPFAIVDSRIRDLAIDFWEDPDQRLMTGYRRLEDIVRAQTGLKEGGSGLFSKTLLGNKPILYWKNIDKAESIGRANLFVGSYMAHRNPRAHHEEVWDAGELLSEFLLLNHLYRLQGELKKFCHKNEKRT